MKKSPSISIIWLSVIALSLIWGSTWLAIKIGLQETPPFFSAALRFVIAALCLLGYMRHNKKTFPATFEFWKKSALLALFMFIVPYVFVYWGGMYVSSGLSSVLFSSQALFVVLCSHYILADEKATLIKWAGLLAGMSGLVFIFNTRFRLASDLALLGMLGIISGALSAAYALVRLRKTGEKSDHLTGLASQICITALFFIVLSPCLEKFPRDLSSPSLWLCAAYLGIVGTALAFLVYYWLAKHAAALTISFSVYLTPVLALFLGWLILHEHVGAKDIIGTVIVIISIIAAQADIKPNSRLSKSTTKIRLPGAEAVPDEVNEN